VHKGHKVNDGQSEAAGRLQDDDIKHGVALQVCNKQYTLKGFSQSATATYLSYNNTTLQHSYHC